MRSKILPILGMILCALTFQVNAQVYISEDFSGASGSTPPTGWTNNTIVGTATDVWVFNNPGSRGLNAPISSPAAIFDSDNYSNNSTAEDVTLESPAFDASGAALVLLAFDHYFQGGFGGAYEVEVFDGTTWVSVLSGTTSTANPAQEVIDISTEAAGVANAQVRFRWTGDYSWYWILDNVTVLSPLPTDAATLALTAPTAGGCLSNMETVTAEFVNVGFLPLNLTLNPVTVAANIDDGTSVQSFSAVANTGTLMPGDTQSVDVTTMADFSMNGTTYDIEIISTVAGVAANANDTASFSLTTPPLFTVPLPTVSFTGFNGGNLSSISTGWLEGDGLTHPDILGTSGWTNDDFANVSANGISAKINLYNTSHTDWLISPRFTATSSTYLIYDIALTLFGSTTAGNMGSDDSVQVMISTDCGLSYSPIAVYDTSTLISNTGQTDTVDLSSYAGQNIIVAFFAKDAPVDDAEDVDIFIDNIRIKEIYQADIIALSVDSLASSCGLSATEQVGVTFRNDGAGLVSDVLVSFSVDGGAFSTPESAGSAGAGMNGSHVFSATADLSAVGTHTITVVATANTPAEENTMNDTLTFTVENIPVVSSLPYFEDFENGSGGWTVSGTNSTWGLGMPAAPIIDTASSGVNAWVTNLTGDYLNNDNSAVVSPCFDMSTITGNVWVAMDIWLESEGGWDGASLQSSNDDGMTWSTVGSLGDPWNWYNDDDIDGAPGDSLLGWTGSSGGWFRAYHPLDTSVLGKPAVKFRVAFGSDGFVTEEGIAFDNFAVGVPPVADFGLGDTVTACIGSVLDLGVPNAAIYDWTTGDSTQSIMITNSTGAAITDSTIIGLAIDTLGFFDFDTVTVNIPATAVMVSAMVTDSIACAGDTDGQLVAMAMDGDAPYTFTWNTPTPVSNDTLSGVGAGTYVISLADSNGCVVADTVMLIQPDSVAVALNSISDASCFGRTDGVIDISVSGGTMPYSFMWSDGSTGEDLNGVGPGDYSGTITDANGCMLTSPMLTVGYTDTLPTADFTFVISGGEVNFTATTTGDSIAWDFGDGSTGGDVADPSYTYTANATYDVVLTVYNDCGTTTVTKSVEMNTVGLEADLLSRLITMHPNPASDFVELNFQDLPRAAWTVRLYTSDGRMISSESLKQQSGDFSHKLDLGQLAKGIYLVQVVSTEGAWTSRLSVE